MRRVKIYDTLTRSVRLFQPIFPPRVGLFVCGLTPYAEAHIGHAKVAVTFDVVARALRKWGYRVLSIQNVTNLDDHVIERAGEEGGDPMALAERHAASWFASLERLGVRSVNAYPRATDYIPEILAQITTLIEGGFAYASDGSVYFEIAKFPRYGALSGQDLAELRAGARVEVERGKRAPEDFVIWKAARPGEPSWESPWGPGRPGWHIEDTAITLRLLGEQYDLHGAGLDLKFPHHEAEIALAESATGKVPFVRFWMHVGLLTMKDAKMSKSLGNVVGLEAVLDEWSPQVLRFYYLNAHYRSPLDFVPGKSLEEGREAYDRLAGPFRRLEAEIARAGPEREGEALPADVERASAQTVEALDDHLADDFATREAIARLYVWGRTVTEWLPRAGGLSSESLESLAAPYRWAQEMLGLLERSPASAPSTGPLGGVVEVALRARNRARKRSDFAEADAIRSELKEAGVELEDDGTTSRWTVGSG